jgi:hypothetical protein
MEADRGDRQQEADRGDGQLGGRQRRQTMEADRGDRLWKTKTKMVAYQNSNVLVLPLE